MRTLLAAAMLLAAVAAVAAPADARALACTDVLHPTCPGFYCVDEDLDGHIEPRQGECTYMACPTTGCCSTATCPPPYEW